MPILYFLDNELYLKDKDELYILNLKDCMKYNYITNYKKCIKKLENFLKKNTLKKINFHKGIILLNECVLNQSYKKILFYIFDTLGINKIKYVSLKELLNLKSNEVVLNITNNYWQIFTTKKMYLIDPTLFNNRITDCLQIYLKNNKVKNIMLINQHKTIAKTALKIEQLTAIKTYYINDKVDYVLKLLTKKYKIN